MIGSTELVLKVKFEVLGLVRMSEFLLFKTEVPGSSLMGHLPKEFSLRFTWCPWLIGY